MNHYSIVMVGYNSAPWIRKCVESALEQNHSDFEVVAIDAETNDGTYEILKEYETHENFKLIRNDPRKYQSENIKTGVMESADNSIICTLDFDDWLIDSDVLTYLDTVYNDNVWMTYGQYSEYWGEGNKWTQGRMGRARYPRDVEQTNSFRKAKWKSTHLRTFRKELFMNIKDEDFIDSATGKMYTMAGDVSFMIPMLEMCGERYEVASRPLYAYNRTNPISDDKVSKSEQRRQAADIRKKKCYSRLDSL